MDGITDAPMRAYMAGLGAFSYAVTEFVRVSGSVVPTKVFRREVPELESPIPIPVHVQLLGGDPDRMAESALRAVAAGAVSIDLNFGCPAPVVNRHDGGAALLRHPCRLRDIVRAVRDAVPAAVPVSAKMRLGYDDPSAIDENAAMGEEGGASWITIHARTKAQGYRPPVDWSALGRVRARAGVPIVANGDIWSLDDFRLCRDLTGCDRFMIGRGALASPRLPGEIARELGIGSPRPVGGWAEELGGFVARLGPGDHSRRLKGWLHLAHLHGAFDRWEEVKRLATHGEILAVLTPGATFQVAGVRDLRGPRESSSETRMVSDTGDLEGRTRAPAVALTCHNPQE